MRSLVLFIAFFNTDLIDRSLQSFAEEKSRRDTFDVVVLENESPHSPAILEVVKKYRKLGLVVGHLRWGKNVAANVITRAVLEGHLEAFLARPVAHYDFIGVTEGDVVLDAGLFQEAEEILEKCPELDQVAADTHLTNLPLKNFPEAVEWVPPAQDHGSYLVGETGLQFVLCRTEAFFSFLGALARGELREMTVLTWLECAAFSDRNWRHFTHLRGKKWARTKKYKLLHIGWELYENLDNDYVRYKNELVRLGTFWQDDGSHVSVRRL